jgi:hypothetical protein
MNVSLAPIDVAIDPRLAFLAQAAVRHTLVEAGENTLDEAFAGLVRPFLNIITDWDRLLKRAYPNADLPEDHPWRSDGWREAAIEYRRNRRHRHA